MGVMDAVVAESADVDALGELFPGEAFGEILAAVNLAGDHVMEGQGRLAVAEGAGLGGDEIHRSGF